MTKSRLLAFPFVIAFAFALVCTASITVNAQEVVPNGFPAVFGKMRGNNAELLLMSSGGSMGAASARVFIDAGSLGMVESNAFTSKNYGRDYGSRLSGFFSGGELFITNALLKPDECHACFTRLLIRRMAFINGHVIADGETIIDFKTWPETKDAFQKRMSREIQNAHYWTSP